MSRPVTTLRSAAETHATLVGMGLKAYPMAHRSAIGAIITIGDVVGAALLLDRQQLTSAKHGITFLIARFGVNVDELDRGSQFGAAVELRRHAPALVAEHFDADVLIVGRSAMHVREVDSEMRFAGDPADRGVSPSRRRRPPLAKIA